MNNSSTRLVVYSALLTAGVVCMLVGFRWLFFLGFALALLSNLFSSRLVSHWKPVVASVVCLAYAAWVFVESYREQTAFSKEPPGVLFAVLFVGAWLLGMALEWRARRVL